MILIQILGALLLVALQNGPIAHGFFGHIGEPNFVIIYVWLWSWFGSTNETLLSTLLTGLLLDITGFLPFGFWLVVLTIGVLPTIYLKRRYLDESSILHAIVALVITQCIVEISTWVIAQQISWQASLLSLAYDLVLGVVIYYGMAVRGRLFQRWSGRRVT